MCVVCLTAMIMYILSFFWILLYIGSFKVKLFLQPKQISNIFLLVIKKSIFFFKCNQRFHVKNFRDRLFIFCIFQDRFIFYESGNRKFKKNIPPPFPEKLNGSSLIDITLFFDKNKICKSTFIQCYFCVLYRLSSLYLTGCFYYTFVTTNYIKSLICNIYFEVQGCLSFFLKGDLFFSFFSVEFEVQECFI